ncbi:septum formation family protein [Nocardiopsis sp. NPDC050513]|uniref:septum formation family protein n=1 Tax=Nocardiopsis sp. NPDC050513 TaxID=3364338 RepID=UPI0037A62F04
MSETRRPIPGRTALGLLTVGAALALSACGPLPLLPPALTDGGSVEPEPIDPDPAPSPEPAPTLTPEPQPTEPEGPTDVNVFALGLGDCLNDYGADDAVSEVPVIDCGEPHDYEVYYVGDLEGDEFPGREEVIDMTTDRCREEFDAFVGIPYMESELDFTLLFPTESGWNDADDREILCLIYEMSGEQATGSLEGARR